MDFSLRGSPWQAIQVEKERPLFCIVHWFKSNDNEQKSFTIESRNGQEHSGREFVTNKVSRINVFCFVVYYKKFRFTLFHRQHIISQLGCWNFFLEA